MIGQQTVCVSRVLPRSAVLTCLTNEEVCRLGNVGRMIWIVVWIPKLAVPLINTIGKAHQYIGGYLNETHVVSYNLSFVSDITSKQNRTSVNPSLQVKRTLNVDSKPYFLSNSYKT